MVFVVFLAYAFVLPFMPLFVRELGVREEGAVALWSGVLIGVSPLLAGLLAPVWGRLATRYGHKRMAVRALGSYIVILSLSAIVESVEQLFVLRVFVGLLGGVGPLGLAMVAATVPAEATGRALGSVQSAQILAGGAGPLLGGLAADAFGIRPSFVVTAGLCGIALFMVARGYEEEVHPEGAPRPGAHAGFLDVLKYPSVLPLLAVLFLVSFAGRSLAPILPLYVGRLGVAPHRLALSAGAVLSAHAVAAAVASLVFGRAAATVSPRWLLATSLALGGAALLPMAWTHSYLPLLLLATGAGLALGGALTLGYTLGTRFIPPASRTAAMGFFSGAALFGGALAPWVAGSVALVALETILYVDAALLLIVAASVFVWDRSATAVAAADSGGSAKVAASTVTLSVGPASEPG